MKLAPVLIVENTETRRWRAECEKCGYYSMWHSQYATAVALANEHRKTRYHRTNSVSYRFGAG